MSGSRETIRRARSELLYARASIRVLWLMRARTRRWFGTRAAKANNNYAYRTGDIARAAHAWAYAELAIGERVGPL